MNDVYWYLLGGILVAAVLLTELLASPARRCPRCEPARRALERRQQDGCCCGHGQA